MFPVMNTARDRLWTMEACLAWGDQREGKRAFDGQRVIAQTARVACQRVIRKPRKARWPLRAGVASMAILAVRRQTGSRVRNPDVGIARLGLGGTPPLPIVYQDLMFVA